MRSRYPEAELAADRAIHVVAIVVGAVGALAIVARASVFANARTFSAVVVYTLALLALLCASAAHNCGPTRAGKDLRRRVDHAAIFVMIAFQATPVVQGESDPPSAAARLVFCRSRSTELGARFRPRFGDVETDLV